jgi:ankyrin repeat protein
MANLYLFTACEQGDFPTLETHLKSLSSSEICSIRDENKASLIHYASRYGHLNILKYFIEIKNIDISQLRTEHGATCAHDAAVCDQVEILKYIFHHNKQNFSEKLRWTVRDEQGNTPLHLGNKKQTKFSLRKKNPFSFSG